MSSQESLGVTTFEIYYTKEHFVGSLARASKSTCAPIQNELTYLHKAGAEPKQKPIIHVFLHSLAFILTHFLPIHQVPTSSLSLLIQSFCNHLIERKKDWFCCDWRPYFADLRLALRLTLMACFSEAMLPLEALHKLSESYMTILAWFLCFCSPITLKCFHSLFFSLL